MERNLDRIALVACQGSVERFDECVPIVHVVDELFQIVSGAAVGVAQEPFPLQLS